MSDRDMRRLLQDVMDDIESGRIRRTPRRFRGLAPWLAPPLLAASLGLAACDSNAVGTHTDAAVSQDAAPADGAAEDATSPMDGGFLYAAPFDAGPDAEVDSGVMPPYMAPPWDGGPSPDYASPFDGGVDDGGGVPLYFAPPPEEPAQD